MAFDKYFAERTRIAASYLFYAILTDCITSLLVLDKVDGFKQQFSLTNIARYAEYDQVPVRAVGHWATSDLRVMNSDGRCSRQEN